MSTCTQFGIQALGAGPITAIITVGSSLGTTVTTDVVKINVDLKHQASS